MVTVTQMNPFGMNPSSTPTLRPAVERRSNDRFPIEREVRFKVLSKRHEDSGLGTTLNMSSSGVLFTAPKTLIPGKRVELAISWPAQLDNRCALKLVARGRVVRSQEGRTAVEFQQYEFRTLGTQGLTV
jgi:hypothetical protein